MTRIEWGEFEYDGRELLFGGHARMPPEQLPSFLLTADGDDRPHAWWIAQTKLYELKTSPAPSVREIRELLAQAIRHGRLVVPEVLRQAERDADAFLRLTSAREGFARRHNPPPTPRTSPPPKTHGPATPSRPSSPPPPGPSPRPSQSSPGAMSLQGMLAHPTLMSLPLAAPVPVPSPTPHALPLFTLVPQPGGIPVPAPGPNPPPLVPAYARYAAYTTVVPPRANYTPSQTAASSPTPQHSKPENDDDHSSPAAEIDELDEDGGATRPASKNGPAPPADAQPDRPKKRSRPTRAHPSSPRVCTTCSRTDSPEWRRGPYGPKTLCNACGLKWAKASGAGRRRGGGQPSAPVEPWKDQYPPTFSSNPGYPPYPPPEHPDRRHEISRPGTAEGFPRDRPEALARSETAPELAREPRAPLAPLALSMPPSIGPPSGPSSAPIGAVPPPPHSVNGSDSDERVKLEGDVKSESDAASGLMDLANVALESRQDPPSLKRPRADSGYDVGRGRPGYDSRHPDVRPYVDSRSFSDSRAFDPPTGSGVRQIDVIPIGGDKW